MERVEGMEILAARLASFEAAHPAPKRRASSAKSSKSLVWPHESPSPAELAHAGFFFKPSSSSPDNTVCFLCGKYLDGWEQNDDPVQEHIKHSPDCGWAIMTSMERLDGEGRTAEDPTGSRMTEARISTFLSIWPHEGKRGWTCKTEKMVEAGWYFCPTQESDDFVTCAYCSLCLDGWEPKDDPFYEHQNRSPQCRFFNYITQPTTKRSRKGRASKPSRMSTQSIATTVSETHSIPDLDISIDQSGLSDISGANSTMPAQKKSKKSSRIKAPAASTSANSTKGKQRDATQANRIPTLSVDYGQPQSELPMPGLGRGKKRTSDEMNDDARDREDRESTVKPQRPQKRRTTRSSVADRPTNISMLSSYDHADEGAITENEDSQTVKKSQKGRKRGHKRGTSASRKSFIASKPSPRSTTLRDSDLEAALEADLDRPLTDDDDGGESLHSQAKREMMSRDRAPSTSADGRPKHKMGTREISQEVLQPADLFERRTEDPALVDAQRMPTRRTRGSALSVLSAVVSTARQDTDLESSLVTTRTIEDDSGHETDASMANKSQGPRKGGKRKAAGPRKGRAKKGTKAIVDRRTLMAADNLSASIEGSADGYSRQREEAVAREPLEHSVKASSGAKDSRTKPAGKNATGWQESPAINPDEADRTSGLRGSQGRSIVVSSPRPKQTTPSPSPQPSDAENKPPSSRPTTSRPPVFSPSAQQSTRVPLAPSTPTDSSSKRNAMRSFQSSLPWNAVDLENVFFVANENKENASLDPILTSAEKAMTVEEWVSWNAHIGEEKIRKESERLVSIFEREGGRAMRTLEGIECIE